MEIINAIEERRKLEAGIKNTIRLFERRTNLRVEEIYLTSRDVIPQNYYIEPTVTIRVYLPRGKWPTIDES